MSCTPRNIVFTLAISLDPWLLLSITVSMAFPLSRSQGLENVPMGKEAQRPAGQSPKRQPLGELGANTRMAPPTTFGPGKKTTPQSPLKRNSIDVLDDDRGFQYLKRRKITDPRLFPNDARTVESTPIEVRNEGRVLSETARFRPAAGQMPAGQRVRQASYSAPPQLTMKTVSRDTSTPETRLQHRT